jgi:hypothetical protein
VCVCVCVLEEEEANFDSSVECGGVDKGKGKSGSIIT